MALNENILKALLSMDAYNRGYNPSILLDRNPDNSSTNISIANLKILKESDIGDDSVGVKAGFYGVAYEFNDGSGQKIIAYRGTDDNPKFETSLNLADFAALFYRPTVYDLANIAVKLYATEVEITPDVWNGWFIGGGTGQSAQALLAHEFYKDVVGGVENVYSANVSLTGHSLGGGLAGMVAGTYDKSATVFDHVPYQKSLENQWEKLVDPLSPDYDSQLKQILFGDLDITTINLDFLNHKAFSIEGEVLSLIRNNTTRFGLITTSTISETKFSLGSAFELDQASLPEYERLTPTQLHSQSLQVIRMFFGSEDPLLVEPDWDASSPYFWPVLFDTGFAQSIGMDKVAGKLNDEGEYDGILRGIIAYSAIDEGTLIFGDTGIRSLYDDANDLGKALGKAGVNNAIHTYTTDISKVFVQFAGTLALNEIEKSGGWITLYQNVVDGVLTFNTDPVDPSIGSFEVSFIDPVWQMAGGGEAPKIVARDNIVGGIISDSGDETFLRALTNLLWDDNSNDVFARVVFGLEGFATARIEDVIGIAPDQATLYVGMDGNDRVIGSSGNDLILGGSGDDVILTSGSGWDIIHGGAGNDTFYADFGSDTFDGGTDIDTIDYTTQDVYEKQNSGTNNGIRIEADLAKGTVKRSLINGGKESMDFINNVEKIIGASGDDVFKGKEGMLGQGFTGNDQTTERGDLVDFSDYAATNGGVTVDLGAGSGTDSAGGTYTTLDGIEQVIGTNANDNYMARESVAA